MPRVDVVHLGLMLSALGLAYLLPFELLLIAYAVLGPAHYLTEISWLHDRQYFLSTRRIADGAGGGLSRGYRANPAGAAGADPAQHAAGADRVPLFRRRRSRARAGAACAQFVIRLAQHGPAVVRLYLPLPQLVH